MAEHRVGEVARRRERLVVAAEVVAEEHVDRRQNLGTRAVVLGQRQALLGLLAALAEHVRRRHAGSRRSTGTRRRRRTRPSPPGPPRSTSTMIALQPVRVLELVDHDRPEAQLLGLAHPRVGDAAARGRRAGDPRNRAPTRAASRRRTRRRRARAAPAAGRGRARRAPRARPARSRSRASRKSSARSPRASRPDRSTSCSGFAPSLSAMFAAARCFSVAPGSSASELRRGVQLGEPFGDAVLLAELERQRPPGRPERLVDAGQHAAEPVARYTSRAAGAARARAPRRTPPARARTPRRGAPPPGRRRARGSAGRARPRTDGCAEGASRTRGWSRSTPRRAACEVVAAALAQRGPDARAQLTRRLARVGDDEHRVDVEPLVAHRADEPLDQHASSCPSRRRPRRTPRPWPRPLPAARGSWPLDPAHRPEVAPGRALAALGVVPDVAARGSGRAESCARRRARSTISQNGSSSR